MNSKQHWCKQTKNTELRICPELIRNKNTALRICPELIRNKNTELRICPELIRNKKILNNLRTEFFIIVQLKF